MLFISLQIPFEDRRNSESVCYAQAKVQSPSGGPSTNPFLSSPTNNANQPIVDLFGAVPASDNQQVHIRIFYSTTDLT